MGINGIKVINKRYLENNINEIKKLSGKKICAMVKADAYGHGIREISNILKGKVDYLGVSNIDEALIIRENDKDTKILLVGKTNLFKECVEKDISFIIESFEHFNSLLKFYYEYLFNKSIKLCINIHLKINSGMNRLGIKSIEEFKKIYKLAMQNSINIEGVSTHFATADCDNRFLNRQILMFKKFIKEIPINEKPIINVGGSAILREENRESFNDFDMVRVGIAMYGYNADKISKKIKPILKIESKIIKIINIKKGEFVGYSKGFQADRDMIVGVVPLGYGDGIPRNLSNKINVDIVTKGKHIHKCAVIGKICMDMFFIDLTEIKNVYEGDKIIVVKNVKKWAELLQAIPYEILTNFGLIR
ncbi:MAG: alanine racemase [Clostridia bacterium]|nr:alanine racemase [Clostridia bacterium]